MNIKPGVRLLAITPWLSTGCAMAQTQGITKTKIKLGSIQDLFGPVADFGKHGSQGMQLRVDGLNAQSGVHGRKKAILAAEKLVSEESFFAW